MSSYIASDSPSPPSSNWSPSPPPTTPKRLKNVSISEERNETSPSPPLHTSGSLFWNASLLYYTGQSSPKIKQHHLRSSVSMSDMNRPISPASKPLAKSPSNDSGTGTCSSATTVVSSNEDDNMSPLRRRHLSCGSTSTASSNSMGSLKKGKLSSSMRMMKALSNRPTLASFMERTQSLGRYGKNKSASPGESTLDDPNSPSNSTETTATHSKSGLSSTAKVLRDSFRAARNLLPSSTKLVIAARGSGASLKKQVSSSSSSLHSDTNESASTINYSAPNTPKVVGKNSLISSEKGTQSPIGDLTLGASCSNFLDPKGVKVTPTFTTSTAIVKTNKSSNKTESLDVTKDSGGSKSISSKLKTQGKDTDTEKVASKKVSLVKSLSRMRIGGRSKEKKEKNLSADSKSVSESTNPPLQEIVELENEPRVRTPKSVRTKRLTSPSPSYPERDREFNEMEVLEDAVEIARHEKLSQESETDKSLKEVKEAESKSQTLSQSQSKTSQHPSVIKEEDNKGNKSSKAKDKGSKKMAGSSSATTGTLMGDDKNFSYPEGYPPLPPSMKKVKAKKGGRGKQASLEPETKQDAKLLETKLDLEDEDPINEESGTNTRAKVEQPHSASSSSNYPREDHHKTSTSRDNTVNIPTTSTKDNSNDELKNNPATKYNRDEKEGVVVQENNSDVTSGPNPDDKDLKPTASIAEGDQEADEDTYCTDSFRKLKPFNFDLEPMEEGKRERLYKVLVVGELGAGKTSIIKRYVHQFFSQHYRATIGVDFALKVLRWDPDTVVRLQLWDIAGQERFGSMTRVYYKEAVGAFVVFDVTRGATLEAVPKWKADLDSKVALPDGRPIPTVLLANKSDQPKEGIAANREKMNDFCQQQGFAAWFETSAKDNINIDESANFLVSKILEMDRWSQEPPTSDPDKVDLSANGKLKSNAASNCSC